MLSYYPFCHSLHQTFVSDTYQSNAKFCLLSIGFFGIFEKKMPILEFGYQNFTSILLYIKITSVNVSFQAQVAQCTPDFKNYEE